MRQPSQTRVTLLMPMQSAQKASVQSAAAVTVMAATAASAMVNVLNAQSAATMQTHLCRKLPPQCKPPTVVKAISQSPTAALPKAQARLWLKLHSQCLHRPLNRPSPRHLQRL